MMCLAGLTGCVAWVGGADNAVPTMQCQVGWVGEGRGVAAPISILWCI